MNNNRASGPLLQLFHDLTLLDVRWPLSFFRWIAFSTIFLRFETSIMHWSCVPAQRGAGCDTRKFGRTQYQYCAEMDNTSFVPAGIRTPRSDPRVERLVIRYRSFVQRNAKIQHARHCTSGLKKNHKHHSFRYVITQGMVVEVEDEVVSSFIDQNKVISDDLSHDFTSNSLTNNGSNACVYLCTKIAHELFNSDILNIDHIKKLQREQ